MYSVEVTHLENGVITTGYDMAVGVLSNLGTGYDVPKCMCCREVHFKLECGL